MAFDRQPQSRHRRHLPRPAGHDDADLLGPDRAARGLHPGHRAILDIDAGDLAILQQVDAAHIGAAGKAPGHRIMARGAAARVIQPAIDGKADIVEIEIGGVFAYPLAVQQDGVVALVDHGIAAPGGIIALAVGMEQVDDAALGMHDVVVQRLFQPFPQFQRVGIELGIARHHVIGAHDRGVAPDIAAADIALFQHRDIAQPVFGGQVIGGGQAMAATADDHDVIGRLRLRVAPMRAPATVAGQSLLQDAEAGKSHGLSPRAVTGD